LKIKIENFKSIKSIELELAPATLLIGPPASGKSNILDALSLIGYFRRFEVLHIEYDGIASKLEPLTYVARFSDSSQLFRYHNYAREISIEATKEIESMKLKISFEKGQINVRLNNYKIPWNLTYYPSQPMQEIKKALDVAVKGMFLESRLYGFDRYGLGINTCSAYNCGFHRLLRNEGGSSSSPKNIESNNNEHKH